MIDSYGDRFLGYVMQISSLERLKKNFLKLVPKKYRSYVLFDNHDSINYYQLLEFANKHGLRLCLNIGKCFTYGHTIEEICNFVREPSVHLIHMNNTLGQQGAKNHKTTYLLDENGSLTLDDLKRIFWNIHDDADIIIQTRIEDIAKKEIEMLKQWRQERRENG
jgi:hypothetical protein